MFFLNLSLPEFLALLGTLSATIVALYLLDRPQAQARGHAAFLPSQTSRPI